MMYQAPWEQGTLAPGTCLRWYGIHIYLPLAASALPAGPAHAGACWQNHTLLWGEGSELCPSSICPVTSIDFQSPGPSAPTA